MTPSTRVRRHGQRLTAEEKCKAQDTFLKSFAESANVTLSSKKAHVSRNLIYTWLEKDEAFSLRYHQAELEANDALLKAAWDRAVNGTQKHIVSMGKVVYHNGKPLIEREYSDQVLLRLMSWRIAGFKETNPGTTINNVNLQMQRNEVYAHLQEDELDQLEALWQSAQERRERGSS